MVPGGAGALEPDQTSSVHSRAGACLIVARALDVLWRVAQGAVEPHPVSTALHSRCSGQWKPDRHFRG